MKHIFHIRNSAAVRCPGVDVDTALAAEKIQHFFLILSVIIHHSKRYIHCLLYTSQSSCRLQSELRRYFCDLLHLAALPPFVYAIVADVYKRQLLPRILQS